MTEQKNTCPKRDITCDASYCYARAGRYNDDFDTTGEYRKPVVGEVVAYYGGVSTHAHSHHLRGKYHILKRRETIFSKIGGFCKIQRPSKKTIIKALNASIKHWQDDILDNVIDGNHYKLEVGHKHCALCGLFGITAESRDTRPCFNECPLGGCGTDSVYGRFFYNKTPENALAVIMELKRCKEAVSMEVNECCPI